MNLLERMTTALKDEIRAAVVRTGFVQSADIPDFVLEVPREKEHGDWATNIAMKLTKIARRNPREIANSIVAEINQEKAAILDIEIAGPGFINFFMDRSFLRGIIEEVKQAKETYGRTDYGQGEKINVEFCSANPTGHLHLGHARGSAVGSSLCNVLDRAGFDVTAEYYINDAGNQMHMMALSIEARYLEVLGKAYTFPEDGYRGREIIDMAKALSEKEGDRLLALPAEERIAYFRAYGKQRLLDKIEADLKSYGVEFAVWFSESSLYESGAIEQTLTELTEKGFTYEKDGALWLKSTAFGDDKDRVLVKQDGSYTYLTPDIAYHRNKFHRGFNRAINIWGADHHGYIARMKAALTALGYAENQLEVIITQMVKLYQGGELVKMSKRTGKAITLVELLEEVGTDAARYFFTMRSADSHLDFDMDLAVSKSNDNPVYYVQYAHARVHSVFKMAEEKGIKPSFEKEVLARLKEEQEYDLLQKLAEFPHEINEAANQLAPYRIIRYLSELAAQFHSYYNAHRVVTDDKLLAAARLALLTSVAQVIRNGLHIVGVQAPEQM
ncbi:arginine--tRNA ligase [Hazenella sp. IB182357]|uniref:Arginine--tRNA ligase n=1 Tax=Polycladospora coralii TaxID=2771432 RepID=A0A926NB35_9BACL|nr:arginine--tRNA ligase [Polycladospora coralii]MBD1372020.1 arginine--tRNA ligase [Polycladospora coralii]MBS7530526.1 arginine--tRNA ligase [Polycladospora coralii]